MTAPIRKIHWNSFPARTRARLLASFEGKAEPKPLFADPRGFAGPIVGWSLLALPCLVVTLGVASDGFGSMYSFVQGPDILAAYVALAFVGTYGLLAIVRAVVRKRALPYRLGRYLLPIELVIAEDDGLTLLPLTSMTGSRIVHHYRNGVYSGTNLHLTFPGNRNEMVWIVGETRAVQVAEQLHAARLAYLTAKQRGDHGTLERLDALSDVRDARELDDAQALASFREQHEREMGTPLARVIPAALRRASLTALAVALVTSVPFWFVRNLLSDVAAFETVTRATRPEAAEAYLEADGMRSEEVRSVHLPRATFAAAVTTNTVGAFRGFLQRFPNSPQVPEARSRIHAIFSSSLASFLAQAPADPGMTGFVRELLAYLESHGAPTVEVRFTAPDAAALATIDDELAQRGHRESGVDVVPIAPHFTEERTAPLESTVTSRLSSGFVTIFPGDVLDLRHAGRVPAGTPLAPGTPALEVHYAVRPSGALYTRRGDTRGFVGIHVSFDVTMRIPESNTTFAFEVSVEPPETFSVSTRSGEHASDGSIYATMTERAFDQLGTRLHAVFFGASDAPGVASATAGKPQK